MNSWTWGSYRQISVINFQFGRYRMHPSRNWSPCRTYPNMKHQERCLLLSVTFSLSYAELCRIQATSWYTYRCSLEKQRSHWQAQVYNSWIQRAKKIISTSPKKAASREHPNVVHLNSISQAPSSVILQYVALYRTCYVITPAWWKRRIFRLSITTVWGPIPRLQFYRRLIWES